MERLEEFHSALVKISNIDKFDEELKTLVDFKKFDQESKIEIGSQSPDKMLAIRHLALNIGAEGDYEEGLKAKWQRYWLRCCLSDRCDYYFALFAKFNIDREKDILELCDKNSILWKYVGSEEGRKYYLKVCMSYLLRRYSWRKTLKLGKLNLFPRLLGSIILGILFLISAGEMWELPTNLWGKSHLFYIVINIVFLFLSVGYTFFECHKTTEYHFIKILGRVLWVNVMGLFYSLVLSGIAVEFFQPTFQLNFSPNFWLTVASFTVESLFIGIFLQIFWEEKTITEPL